MHPYGTAAIRWRRTSPDTRVVAFLRLNEREPGRAVDRHEETELVLPAMHFGDIDAEEAGRAGFDLPLRGLLAVKVEQPGYAMPLKAAAER